MAGLVGSILLFEVVEDVTYAQTVAAHLVSIGRANALTGGAYLVLALLCLVGSVEYAVGGHDEMCLLRNVQALTQLMAAGLQCLCLLHEEVGGEHDAIADNVYLATLEDARGDGAKNILLTFKLQGVSSIGTALETGYHIILRGQHVDHLTFSFVAPLESQQDINFTLIHR